MGSALSGVCVVGITRPVSPADLPCACPCVGASSLSHFLLRFFCSLPFHPFPLLSIPLLTFLLFLWLLTVLRNLPSPPFPRCLFLQICDVEGLSLANLGSISLPLPFPFFIHFATGGHWASYKHLAPKCPYLRGWG